MKQFFLATGVAAALAVLTPAQVVLPTGFTATVVSDGPTLGIPPFVGGLTFSPDGATLYVAGAANGPAGAVYAVPVVRDPVTQAVTGLLPATFFHAAPFIDGGLAIDPLGTFYYTTFPTNELGQFTATTSVSYALPVASNSTGALCFGRTPGPNAGKLYISSYGEGDIFECPLVPNGNGTSTPTGLIPWAELPFGTEGIAFVPSGPAAGDLFVTNFSLGSVTTIDVDAMTGTPLGGATTPVLVPFATGIIGAEGFAFDPITNDFFVSTFAGAPSDAIYRISGFPGPNFPMTAGASTISAATGGFVPLAMNAGVDRAFNTYVMFSGASGSTPGVTVGFQHVPLNYDEFSELVLPLVNTPFFINFVGSFDAFGDATAYFAPPQMPPVAIGLNLTFCAVSLFPTFSGASQPANIMIVP